MTMIRDSLRGDGRAPLLEPPIVRYATNVQLYWAQREEQNLLVRAQLGHFRMELAAASEKLRRKEPAYGFADYAQWALGSIALSDVPTRHEAKDMSHLHDGNWSLSDVEAVIDLIDRTLQPAD